MKFEYAELVIKEIRENPGITYGDLSKKFLDEEEGQLYRLLYGLCAPEKSQEGTLLNIITKEEREIQGRGIERGKFRFHECKYSRRRLEKIFSVWEL